MIQSSSSNWQVILSRRRKCRDIWRHMTLWTHPFSKSQRVSCTSDRWRPPPKESRPVRLLMCPRGFPSNAVRRLGCWANPAINHPALVSCKIIWTWRAAGFRLFFTNCKVRLGAVRGKICSRRRGAANGFTAVALSWQIFIVDLLAEPVGCIWRMGEWLTRRRLRLDYGLKLRSQILCRDFVSIMETERT